MADKMMPTPRGQDSYERRPRKTMEKIRDEGGDMTLPTFIATSLPTSRYSRASVASTSPLSRTASSASGRWSMTEPAQTSWLDGGPESPGGETSTGSMLLPTPNVGDAKQAHSRERWEQRQKEHASNGVNLHESLPRRLQALNPPPPVLHPSDEEGLNKGWTSSPEAIPASPSQPPASAAAPTIRATSGPSSPVLLASFDPEESCWRTFQATLASELPRFSQTLPRSGMTRHGRLYALPMWERRTAGSDGSASLPTPSANQYEAQDAETIQARRERERAKGRNGNGFGLTTAMALTLLHSPTASDKDELLPTPTSSDMNGTGEHGTGGPDLRTSLGDLTNQPSEGGKP